MTDRNEPGEPTPTEPEPPSPEQQALTALQAEATALATDLIRRFGGPPPKPLQALNIAPSINTAMMYPQVQSMVCRQLLVAAGVCTDLQFETMQASITRDLLAGLLHTLEEQELTRPSGILLPNGLPVDAQQAMAEILGQQQGKLNGAGRKVHD